MKINRNRDYALWHSRNKHIVYQFKKLISLPLKFLVS